MSEEKEMPPPGGTMILFGAHTGKPDPRFPVQIEYCAGGEKFRYISVEQHTALLAQAVAEAQETISDMIELLEADYYENWDKAIDVGQAFHRKIAAARAAKGEP